MNEIEKPKSYCEAIANYDPSNVHRIYHDNAYGFPIYDDNELFERLVLEINQAGLSWTTVLNKLQNFRKAFHQFQIQKVAAYQEADRERLLNDAGIIRNRLKIDATIHNANVILDLQSNYGSFKNWLDQHHPRTLQEWTKLFRQTFKFTGGEIVNEFLMSTGYLPGAHIEECPYYKEVIRAKPAWLNV
jgi:DNA-3-methyladenine glycosylase I